MKIKLVAKYGVKSYQCGLVAGDRLRLRKRLNIKNHQGKLTGQFHRAGEIWTVLTGSRQTPGVLWLKTPAGERHTWDDSDQVFLVFSRSRQKSPKL